MTQNALYHSLLVCDFNPLGAAHVSGSQTLQRRLPRWDARSSYRYLQQWLPEDLVALDAWGCKSGPGVVWVAQINGLGFVLLQHCLS